MIEKDAQVVAGFGVVWHKSFWQKDAVAAVIEDEADGELSFNDQVIVFADADHWVKVRFWAKKGMVCCGGSWAAGRVSTGRRRGGARYAWTRGLKLSMQIQIIGILGICACQ